MITSWRARGGAFVVLGLLVGLLAAATPASGASAWPGNSAVSTADDANVFGKNLSGLAYQPSGSSAPGVLWAVRNSPSTLFRLIHAGTKWKPDPSGGWSAGKQLLYPDGTGKPDAEGVTLVGGDANGIYVSVERNGSDAQVSRPAVLRYDVSSPGATLTATREWNLTTNLPGLDPNEGLEAVAWVPDSLLVANGFQDEATVAAYNPASYPNHGTGLFFVGVEANGQIIAYALDQTSGSFSRVATIASGFSKVMDLEYEPESTHLWAVCDNSCDGQSATLDIAPPGPNAGKFVVTNEYERPTDMPNLNNEGFTVASQAECLGGLKPAFWSDDANTGNHALRTGTLNCTPLGPDADSDGFPDASDRCDAISGDFPSGCPTAARSLTFSYSAKTDVLKGKLSAPTAPACADGEQVRILRTKRGADQAVTAATTKPSGKWSKTKALPKGKLYAQVNSRTIDDVATCTSAKSKSLNVG